MNFCAALATAADTLPLREQYRAEMNCQIVHDSIHRRNGWTRSWILEAKGQRVGFGSVAEAGPWKTQPALFEFFVVPDHRTQAFRMFEQLLQISGAQCIETQSNSVLLATMLHTFSQDVKSQKIIFADATATSWPGHGAVLRRVSTPDQDRARFANRDGSTEWQLMLDNQMIAQGGVAFHYNAPYGDVYMDVLEPHRRRGYGVFLVQELKRICRDLGGIPAARCSPDNIASRQTCQKAGLIPIGHLLSGRVS
jgi:GNAT superfamily N-acetyltransferase